LHGHRGRVAGGEGGRALWRRGGSRGRGMGAGWRRAWAWAGGAWWIDRVGVV
jgi:hypothetical protein